MRSAVSARTQHVFRIAQLIQPSTFFPFPFLLSCNHSAQVEDTHSQLRPGMAVEQVPVALHKLE